MLKQLEQLFNKLSSVETEKANAALSTHELNLATAALLVEVASIDQQFDEREWQQLQVLLINECALSAEDAAAMTEEAKQASADSASLYDFTQVINQNCSYEQKMALMAGLWKVAYADGELDKYEEYIIRRIADLIHVAHGDFLRAKIQVRDSRH